MYNGYDGFHSRLIGVTEEQGPVMSSFETYPSRRLQLDTADRGSQSRILASSIVLMFNLAALVLALVLEIPFWTAPETRQSGCRRVAYIEESNSLSMARAHELRLRLRIRYLLFYLSVTPLIRYSSSSRLSLLIVC